METGRQDGLLLSPDGRVMAPLQGKSNDLWHITALWLAVSTHEERSAAMETAASKTATRHINHIRYRPVAVYVTGKCICRALYAIAGIYAGRGTYYTLRNHQRPALA